MHTQTLDVSGMSKRATADTAAYERTQAQIDASILYLHQITRLLQGHVHATRPRGAKR